jgi:transposase
MSRANKAELAAQFVELRNNGSSWDEIAAMVPISRTTIQNWTKRNMEVFKQEDRMIHYRIHPLLTIDETREIIRQAEILREQHLCVDLRVTRIIINKVTDGRISCMSNSSISRFWERAGWSSKRTNGQTSSGVRPTLKQEASEFQRLLNNYIIEHDVDISHLVIMDETGLWTDGIPPRTYVDPKTMDSSIISPGPHQRDTGICALHASGEVDGDYIRHQEQRSKVIKGQTVITRKAVSGMNLPRMKQWAEDFGNKMQGEKTVLVMDRLNSHRNPDVLQILRNHNVEPFLMPAQAAKLISPCDNSFFHGFKSDFRKKDLSTPERKEQEFYTLCATYPREKVIEYFNHCGWPHP